MRTAPDQRSGAADLWAMGFSRAQGENHRSLVAVIWCCFCSACSSPLFGGQARLFEKQAHLSAATRFNAPSHEARAGLAGHARRYADPDRTVPDDLMPRGFARPVPNCRTSPKSSISPRGAVGFAHHVNERCVADTCILCALPIWETCERAIPFKACNRAADEREHKLP